MTKLNRFFTASAFFACLSAFAGNERGNGGDSSCSEFMEFTIRISQAAEKRGQTFIDSLNKVIKVEEFKRVSRSMKCLPIANLDRMARTLVNDNEITTTLNTTKWEKLNGHQKLALVAHEMMVAALLEFEGQYNVSLSLVRGLKTMKDFLEINAEDVVYLPNGDVLLEKPFLWISEKAYYFRKPEDFHSGICKFFGFSTAFNYNDNTLKKAENEDGGTNIAVVNEKGEFVLSYTTNPFFGPQFVITQIICRD